MSAARNGSQLEALIDGGERATGDDRHDRGGVCERPEDLPDPAGPAPEQATEPQSSIVGEARCVAPAAPTTAGAAAPAPAGEAAGSAAYSVAAAISSSIWCSSCTTGWRRGSPSPAWAW